MIYFMTEFGRTRTRLVPSGHTGNLLFGTGHDPNNAVLIVSPFTRGNTFLGGIDHQTTRLFGFDPMTGEPRSDRRTSEAELFSGILTALDVDTEGSGLPTVRALIA